MSSISRRAALVALLVAGGAMGYEQPRYEVVRSEPDFELRRYAPYAVAETTVEGDFEEARNTAFRRLFRYISGRNRAQQHVNMTVPVVSAPAGKKLDMTVPVMTSATGPDVRTVMQFVLPAHIDAAHAPEPLDAEVRVRDVGEQLIAARTYSGRITETNFRDNEAKLLGALEQAGLVPTDPARFAIYDGPWTPWFLRRNEVLVPVTTPP